jgi:protease-4
MSKRSCLIVAVVVVIILIILLACCGISVLLMNALSAYDLDAFNEGAQSETLVEGGDDKVAVIKVEGIIMDVESSTDIWGTTYASSQQISSYIDNAMADKDVRAIILSMDTPGGDVYASDLIYNKIKEAQADGLTVVTLMKNTAASGGYYIAAPSDKIIAHELTITGSIGVLAQFQSLDGLYEKLGIETRTIANSGADYKTGEGLFDDDPSGEEDQIYQRIVDEAFDRFVTIVATGRNMDRSEVLAIADGRVFTGKQAQEVGLVDELGTFEEALAAAEEIAGISDATVIEYKEYDFWNMLAGYVSNVVNPTAKVVEAIDTQPGLRLKYLYVE